VPTATGEAAKKIEEKANIANVVSTKDFQYQLNSFFNTYQLTNFLDQQNPLSELSNKRKISAMGDGGISREDKNLNVRDIQISHYGRICPIEAPEGQNVGLIMALGAYAKIDEYGFIESPYRVVKDGKITDEVVYLTSSKESEHIVCDSSIPFDAKTGKILASSYVARYKFETKVVNASDIEYVEISPRQVLSVSTNLIPFAECNEGHRCEMAANMQRQAIPLLAPHAPAVGTGFEHKIALDSSLCLQSENDGVVKYVDSEKIIVGSSTYKLDKFIKSNQDTCINQKPFVNVGDTVKQNQVIADGYAMDNNEIALGQNINVAFIS
jgi:DNA-directed RNA polymerase subunit beta